MRVAAAIFWKDLLIEWRSRDRVVAMLLFSLLTVMVFHFSLPGGATAKTQATAPGLLWIAYVFSALFGLGRSFSLELENDALSGLALAPTDRGWILVGKISANLVILGVAQAVTALVFALVFDLSLLPVAHTFAGIVLLGSLGLCTVGTFFSAIAVQTRFREVMLPLLLLPVLWPLLSAAVSATAALLAGEEVPSEAIRLLIVSDAIYLIVSFLSFDFILDD